MPNTIIITKTQKMTTYYKESTWKETKAPSMMIKSNQLLN